MSYSRRCSLEDGTNLRIKFDRDPARACPGGIVEAAIFFKRPTSFAKISVLAIDNYFELLDNENTSRPLGSNFPVFVANLDGATKAIKIISGFEIPCVEATVRIGYCTNYRASKRNPDIDFSFLHSPEQHREDAIDTCIALATFALSANQHEQPGRLIPEL